METAGYAGGLTPASIVANGKSTAMVPIEGGEYGQMRTARSVRGLMKGWKKSYSSEEE